jgi:hypothetical protein
MGTDAPIPTLERLAGAAYGELDQIDSPEDRLRRLIRDATLKLPADEVILSTKITWQWAAQVIFQLIDVDVDLTEGKLYDNLYAYILDTAELHVARRTASKKIFNALRMRLAKCVIEVVEERRHKTTVGATSYVDRPALEVEVLDHLDGGARLVLITGDAGTGKSTLAEQLARRRGEVSVIHCDDENLWARDLADFLEVVGHELELASTTPLALQRRFARAISADCGRTIVLDNVQDAKLLSLFLPGNYFSRLRTTVLITSRSSLWGESTQLPVVQVGEMEPDEAVDLVLATRPETLAAEAHQLVGELDRRPLAIVHALALLDISSELTVARLVELLKHDLVKVLDVIPQDGRLTTIYREILASLRADESLQGTLKILELILSMGWYVPLQAVDRAWTAALPGEADSAGHTIGRLAVRQGLGYLSSRSLISVRPGEPVVIKMHELTHRLLKAVWIDPTDESIDLLVKGFENYLREIGWRPTDAPDWSCDLVHYYYPLMGATDDDRYVVHWASGDDYRRHALVLAACVRVARRVGDDCSKLMDRVAVLTNESTGAEPASEERFGLIASTVEASLISPEILVSAEVQPSLRLFDPYPCELAYSTPDVDLGAAALAQPTVNLLAADDLSARIALAQGTRVYNLARWSEADSAFSGLADTLEAHAGDGPRYELFLETLRRGIRNSTLSGSEDLLHSWLDRGLRALLQPRDSSRSENAFDLAAHALSETRLSVAHALGSLELILRESLGGNSQDLRHPFARAYRVLQQCGEFLERTHSTHLRRMLAFDQARVMAAHGPCASESANNLGHGDVHHGNIALNSVCRLHEINEAKNLIGHVALHGDWTPELLDAQLLSRVSRLTNGGFVSGDARSRYPYSTADALLTGYALAARAGSNRRRVASLRTKAASALEEIGRPERLVLGERVGSGEWESWWLFAL